MAELRLMVLHYHLLPGGVASVIRDGLVALDRFGSWNRIKVKLLTGSPNSIDSFHRRLQSLASDQLKVDIEYHPNLGYQDPSGPSSPSDIHQLSLWIEKAYSDYRADALWIHNPTLGKNPALTAALNDLARRKPDFRILYQIHDFAECSRFANLLHLRKFFEAHAIKTLYPVSPSLTLVTLTERERERLIEAGYPKAAVKELCNPVMVDLIPEPFSSQERKELDHRIAEWSSDQGFQFTEGGKWLLAPIRTIRRKNVLELALLTLLLGKEWRLLVTLDCNSEPERPYAEFVKQCFRQERLEATLGFGKDILNPPYDFDRLYVSSEAVATTSILEGFGLIFAESVLYGQPLLGRDLPDLTRELPGLSHERLYSALDVPLSSADRKRLWESYQRKLHRCAEQVRIEKDLFMATQKSIQGCFQQDWADFSLLDLPAQANVLHRMKDSAYRNKVECLNASLIQHLRLPLLEPTLEQQEALAGKVGFQEFALRFQEILESPPETAPEKIPPISERLTQSFFKPSYLSLLLDAGDDWRLWPEILFPRFLTEGKTKGCDCKELRLDVEQVVGAVREPPLQRDPIPLHVFPHFQNKKNLPIVLWDVYGTLLVPEVGDLEQRLAHRQTPEPFLETLAAGGFDASDISTNPVDVFEALIHEDHREAKSRGIHQPEVEIETVWQRLVERVLPGKWSSLDQARYMAAYYELSTNRVYLKPGIRQVLEILNSQGLIQGILSNSQFYTPEILKYYLGESFESIFHPKLLFWSYQLKAAKPDPRPFEQALNILQELKMDSHPVIMVGDNYKNDILPAIERGWKTVLLTEEEKAFESEDKKPDLVCEELVDLVEWMGNCLKQDLQD